MEHKANRTTVEKANEEIFETEKLSSTSRSRDPRLKRLLKEPPPESRSERHIFRTSPNDLRDEARAASEKEINFIEKDYRDRNVNNYHRNYPQEDSHYYESPIKKSIWVPTGDVKYIVGPYGNVLNHLKKNGVFLKFTPEINSGEKSKSTNILITGPKSKLANIEQNLFHVVQNEMYILEKQKERKEKYQKMKEEREKHKNNLRAQSSNYLGSKRGKGFQKDMPPFQQFPNPFLQNLSGAFPGAISAHPNSLNILNPLNSLNSLNHLNNLNNLAQIAQMAAPMNNPGNFSNINMPSLYTPHRAPHKAGVPYQQNYRRPFHQKSTFVHEKQKYPPQRVQNPESDPSLPKIVKLSTQEEFLKLAELMKDKQIKKKVDPESAASEPTRLILESPPDDMFSHSVIKLTKSETLRLLDFLEELPPDNQLNKVKDFISKAFDIKRETPNLESGDKKEDETPDEVDLVDLDKISAFLNSFGDFEQGTIPGLDYQETSTLSANGEDTTHKLSSSECVKIDGESHRPKEQKNDNAKRKKSDKDSNGKSSKKQKSEIGRTLSAYSEEMEKALREKPPKDKIQTMIDWLKQCKTFSSFVLSRLKDLFNDFIQELSDLENSSSESENVFKDTEFYEKERKFFERLCRNLSNFSDADSLQIKAKIKQYPRHVIFNLGRFEKFSASQNDSAKIGSKSSSSAHKIKTKRKPLFIEKEEGNCGKCNIADKLFACSWCDVKACKSCHGNVLKPPCKECQRKLTKAEKVILYQSISFEQGCEKVKRSFGGKDELEETSFMLPLFDPFSHKRLETPTKGKDCQHRSAFDLDGFLQRMNNKNSDNCPVCKSPLTVNDLEVDKYIERILLTEPEEVREVTVFQDGSWTQRSNPNPINVVELRKSGENGVSNESEKIDLC